MKPLVVKILLIFPLVCFAFYFLMALIGCIAGIFRCGTDFYCGSFCLIGKILGAAGIILFFFSILPDIKAFLNIQQHASPKKDQKY
jgi:hypothetical protein